MLPIRHGRRALCWVGLASVYSVLPSYADAQAWVAPEGKGSVTFVYQFVDNTGHRLTDGFLLEDGKSVNNAIAVEAEYAFTDRFSVSLGIPYVFAKYNGPGPTPARLPVDNCHCWHSGFQDVGLIVRYNILGGAFALTPSVSVGVPSNAYDYKGEAVVGSRLKELRFAVDAGQRLDAISPNLIVQARYSYAIVEQVLDIPHNRSSATAEVGYLATRRLALRGLVSWQRTHGGLRFGGLPSSDLPFPGEVNTPQRFEEHDRLLRDNHWRVGGGALYSFSRFDVFGSLIVFISGTDTHAGRAWTFGTTWHFERAPRSAGS